MSRYRVIRTVDILGDEEFLVIPEPSYSELSALDRDFPFPEYSAIPFWFDSDISWDASDFTNPEIYQSVETIMVEV